MAQKKEQKQAIDYGPILRRITPNRALLLKRAQTVIETVKKSAAKKKISCEVMLAGSLAKGTILKENVDCDIFVRFSYAYKDKDISQLLKKILADFPVQVVHGSRDYYTFKKASITYEIIPVLHITDPRDAQNVMDMSPLHVAWILDTLKIRETVQSKLSGKKKTSKAAQKTKQRSIQQEIMLAKQFCKATGVYGAESYIGGFSGHVLDILIMTYGSFEQFLREIIKWDAQSGKGKKVIIDPQRAYASEQDILRTFNDAKKFSPLIIVDPVLPDRNAAAALEEQAVKRLQERARAFLAKPSADYFTIPKITPAYLKKMYGSKGAKGKPATHLQIITLKGRKNKPDIVGAKLRKAYEFMAQELTRLGFTLLDQGWKFDKKEQAICWFVFPAESIPGKYIRQGPPITEKDRCVSFKEKYPDTFQKDDRLYAYATREHTRAKSALAAVAQDAYVQEKVAQVKIV